MSQTPPLCNHDIYKNGTLVFVSHTIGSAQMERWVKKVAEKSEQQVDWHFAGGRACVLALGDLQRVRDTILEMLPEHDALQRLAVLSYRPITDSYPFTPSSTIYEAEEWNPAHEFARETVLEREGGARNV